MPSSKKKGKQNQEENVHVVVRIRPLSEDEQGQGAEEGMRIGADKRTIQVLLPDDVDFAGSSRQTVKKFSLDGCLPSRTTQEEVFNSSGVKSLLDSALEGFSATVFAYGQTGSGKTFTMMGPSNDDGRSPNSGLITLAACDFFKRLQGKPDLSLMCCFFEIYSGKLYGKPLQR